MIRFALVAAAVLGFFLTLAAANLLVPLLPGKKRGDAEPLPQGFVWTMRENGKPTMGGLALMLAVLTAVGVSWTAACFVQPELLGDGSRMTTRLLTALVGAYLMGAVGLLDDIARQRSGSVLGLRVGIRLLLEGIAAALEILLLYHSELLVTGFTLPSAGYIELGGAAGAVWAAGLVLIAEAARCINGADGVCSGTAFIAMLGLMTAMSSLGYFPLGVLPAALAGALMAFLLWDFYPAKLLPGQVGCQFLAGAVGCIPLAAGRPILAVPLCLPWLIEGLTALAAALIRLVSGKPVAPSLHHWFEKRGVSAVAMFYFYCCIALCGMLPAVWLAQL